MILFRIRFFIFLFIFSIKCYAQQPAYNISAKLDTAENKMLINVQIIIPSAWEMGDTVWFHFWANAWSKTENACVEEQLKYNKTKLYFRKPSELAEIENLKVLVNGTDSPFYFRNDNREFIGVIVPEEKKVTFSYSIKLPAFFAGLGIRDNNYFLHNFYPKLAVFDKTWSLSPYRQFADDYGYPSAISLELKVPDGFEIGTNGEVKSTKGAIHIQADSIKSLSVILYKNNVKIYSGQFESLDKVIPYKIVFKKDPGIGAGLIDTLIQNIVTFYNKTTGPYPYSSLTVFISEDCASIFKADGLAMVKGRNNIDFLNSRLPFVISDIWVDGHYNIDVWKYPWLRGGLTAYFTDLYFENRDNVYNKPPSDFQFEYYRDIEQSILQHKSVSLMTERDLLDANQEITNRFYKSARAMHFLENLVGKEVFLKMLSTFREGNAKLDPESMVDTIVKLSGKDMKADYNAYFIKDEKCDYEIKNILENQDSITVIAENKKGYAYPFTLTFEYKNQNIDEYKLTGFCGLKQLSFVKKENQHVKLISIDKLGLLPETDRENNHYFPGRYFNHGPLAFVPLWEKGSSRKKELRIAPVAVYNDNDHIMLGLILTNSIWRDIKKFKFAITPVYSLKNKKLLGQAWASYDQYVGTSFFQSVRYRVGLKSFDMNTNATLDYSQRYIRLDPSVTLFFNHSTGSNLMSFVSLKSYFLFEEYPLFAENEFLKLKTERSEIFKLEYEISKNGALSSNVFRIGTEYQRYGRIDKKDNYLKLTTSFIQRYMYAANKNMWFRFFASGFPINTNRRSLSFQNIFTKGSIALIHQGFNDYSYDEYFFSRQNQTRLYDNQVSIDQGGGFKTPLGSATAYGMSNHFAASFNFTADLPFQISARFPVRLYFDAGTYSIFDRAKSKFNAETVYNGGFSLSFKDVFTLYVPLMYSSDLANAYKGQHKTFFSRISFSMQLQKLDLWNTKKTKKAGLINFAFQ